MSRLEAQLLILISFLTILTRSFAAEPLTKIEGCVFVPTKWADGDSFLVRTPNNEEMTIRLYGADCLEWHVTDASDERRLRSQRRYFGITGTDADPRIAIKDAKNFGQAAYEATKLALSAPFTVHTVFADARGDGRHKRIYAFVTTSRGTDLASDLVSAGLARAFGVSRETHDGKSQDEYRAELADLELQAATLRRGVWSKTNWETLPTERKDQRTEDEELAIAMGDAQIAAGQLVDLNSAARDEIMTLPGIGEELANRIIEHRPIQSPSDLIKVPGIGPGILTKITPHLKFPKP
jgi:endonuclease YncB( thermonuclease family)